MDEPLFAGATNVDARSNKKPRIEENIDQYHLLMIQQVQTMSKQQEQIAMAVQAALAAAQAASEVAAQMSRALRPPELGSFPAVGHRQDSQCDGAGAALHQHLPGPATMAPAPAQGPEDNNQKQKVRTIPK
jgi:hypothetical protein